MTPTVTVRPTICLCLASKLCKTLESKRLGWSQPRRFFFMLN
jgi:hypothetical protein